jgi:hypothetical protein
MHDDPIVAEVRRVRREHAARFQNDLSAIIADIRQLEDESGRQYVNFPPRRAEAAGQGAAELPSP